MKLSFLLTAAAAAAILCLPGCGSTDSKGETMSSPTPQLQAEKLQSLSRKKIFFAHQSVGGNIISGIRDVSMKLNVSGIDIVETRGAGAFTKPVFAHARAGANTHPFSKLEDFEKIMASGVGNSADIAFLKFCYVDITDKMDVGKVFAEYVKTMDRLRQRYPKTTFVHVTVPLMTTKGGLKTKIKVLTGKGDLWEYRDNVRRNEFNALLLERYKGKEPVFDLAEAEATTPDGKLTTFSAGGKTYLSLYPPYSDDGGHLNTLGREKVAARLLALLADLPR